MAESLSAHLWSLARFETLRIIRQPKYAVSWVAVFGAPLFFTYLLEPSGARALSLTALFLPVVVGWNWGGDIAAGRLEPLSLGVATRAQIFLTRLFIFIAASLLGASALLLSSRAAPRDVLLGMASCTHFLGLGFLLATLFRRSETGWLPLFLALTAGWLPLMMTIGRSADDTAPRWLHPILALFLPEAAISLQVWPRLAALPALFTLAAIWAAVAGLLFAFRPASVAGAREET